MCDSMRVERCVCVIVGEWKGVCVCDSGRVCVIVGWCV